MLAQGAYYREYRLTWDKARAEELRAEAQRFLEEVATLQRPSAR
ncbi:hypothetical protein ACIQWY_29705 [Streptomyces albidoflavus]